MDADVGFKVAMWSAMAVIAAVLWVWPKGVE